MRPVRAVPGGHRPPGGAAGAPRGRRHNGTLDDELALLDDLGQVLRDASICGLGQTANDAVRTGLRFAEVGPA